VAPIEADAERAMRLDTPAFSERAALVSRNDEARGAASGEPAARLTLLWLRAMRWMLDSIPLAERTGEPNNDWLRAHQELIAWSEPAGIWLISSDVIWKLHDRYRNFPAAEPIAWFAVENGLPGECEGYVPCYAVGMNQLDGEYLRRHPRGAHVTAIIDRVKGTLEQAIALASGKDGKEFLNPATDCGDMKTPLAALRAAVAGSPGTKGRDETLALVDKVSGMCG
jgi:hypothetical protein